MGLISDAAAGAGRCLSARVALGPPVRVPGVRARLAVRSALLLSSVMLAAGGCGPKLTAGQTVARYSQELREAVSTNVHDVQRRQQMLAVVDQVEALQQRFGQETGDFVTSYRKLNADYDASRPAFDRLFADFNAKRVQARSQALDLHFQMAALASTSEWDAIGRAESKLYEKTIEARQGGAK